MQFRTPKNVELRLELDALLVKSRYFATERDTIDLIVIRIVQRSGHHRKGLVRCALEFEFVTHPDFIALRSPLMGDERLL